MPVSFNYTPSQPTQPNQPQGGSPQGGVPFDVNAQPQPQAQLGTLPKPAMPILTNPQGGFGTAVKDIAAGVGKDLMGTARDTAGLLQTIGQKALAPLSGGVEPSGFKSLDNRTPEGKQIEEQLQSKSRGEQTGKVISAVTQLAAPFSGGNTEKLVAKGKSIYEGFQAGREAKATQEATSKIAETISPKATVKQAKIAQTEGRLIEGKEPTLFKAGTEDTIKPSQKTLSAAETINKNIPGAAKMKPTELYKAVDENISKTAKELRPQMEQTPIKSETIQKINDDWTALKKSQIIEAPATEEANVVKRQAKFESLLQKSGNQSHADLWDTRIAYDDSIPERVKQATSISDESLQLQKEEWLQNRAVLNNAIHDTESGMGETTRKAFSEMSNMYEAKNGLLSKAKVNGAELSKFNQLLKDHPTTAKILGFGTAYEMFKKLGLPLP